MRVRADDTPLDVDVPGAARRLRVNASSAEALRDVWIALRANLRKVLERVTVADVAEGKLPKDVVALTRREEAWQTR